MTKERIAAVEFYRRYALEKLTTGRQTAKDLRARVYDNGGMLDVVREGTKLALRQWK